MVRQRRNSSAAGAVLLFGAALIAFSGTQPWAQGNIGAVWAQSAGLGVNGALGFDHLLVPGPAEGDVRPAIFGGAAVMAVAALLLFRTRVRGVGLLWRVMALLAVAAPAWIAAVAWQVVDNPASLMSDGDGFWGRTAELGAQNAESLAVAQASPGMGLWLLTAGSATSVIAVLIPASRSVEHAGSLGGPGSVAGPPAGWYPAPDGVPGRLRFFDGYAWTSHTREQPLDRRGP